MTSTYESRSSRLPAPTSASIAPSPWPGHRTEADLHARESVVHGGGEVLDRRADNEVTSTIQEAYAGSGCFRSSSRMPSSSRAGRNRFDVHNEVVSYAGLNPVIRESGDSRFEGRISKRGSERVR